MSKKNDNFNEEDVFDDDHRAIDGALAARFCATLKYLLADVRRLML